MQAGKPETKVPAASVPGESPLPGLEMGAFSLCPPMARGWGCGEQASSLVSSYKDTDHIRRTPTRFSSSKPHHL